MRRKLICKCGSTDYLVGYGAYMATLGSDSECINCGDKRRAKEDKKKQNSLTRLFEDNAD